MSAFILKEEQYTGGVEVLIGRWQKRKRRLKKSLKRKQEKNSISQEGRVRKAKNLRLPN
ncbi:MAG: hypothetical protein QXP53_01940 [Candidatus Pacearchaeota archaeon]